MSPQKLEGNYTEDTLLNRNRPNERGRAVDEAATGRRAIEQALIRRSLQDGSFRERLLTDPKGTIEQELGRKLPKDLKVKVLEETQDTIYLVLPPGGTPRRSSDELSDVELDSVAGGVKGFKDGMIP